MQVASILEIPVIATAEDIARNGPLVPDLEKQLHAGAGVHDKKVFGLCGQSDILEAVRKTGPQRIRAGWAGNRCLHFPFGTGAA